MANFSGGLFVTQLMVIGVNGVSGQIARHGAVPERNIVIVPAQTLHQSKVA